MPHQTILPSKPMKTFRNNKNLKHARLQFIDISFSIPLHSWRWKSQIKFISQVSTGYCDEGAFIPCSVKGQFKQHARSLSLISVIYLLTSTETSPNMRLYMHLHGILITFGKTNIIIIYVIPSRSE